MTHIEALRKLADHPHAWRWAELCDESHPDHESWRMHVITMAGGTPEYPPLMAMAGSLLVAAGRLARAAVHGGPTLASGEVVAARLATCGTCPEWMAKDRRCRVCGCATDWKIRLAQETCPQGKW